jgi:hypothetical protein
MSCARIWRVWYDSRKYCGICTCTIAQQSPKGWHGFSALLTRYALERLLYRLSISSQTEQFLLKGALLFDLWYDVPFRATRDIDLLGFGLAEIPQLIDVFEELCTMRANDGMSFDVKSIRAEEIRKDAN